ncbi:DUF3800 domain-containing protein [Herpetosiphon sp. NSE202]|uniref:DUF3800 domain-containing protein n=1 Tax=Herpetosiphon sp. NSE202 TaxID=3351349 RepID=UPI003626354B
MKANDCYFFVDESGDPTFYDKRGNLIVGEQGCSKILLLGFIKTDDPARLRSHVQQFQQFVVNKPEYQQIPSLAKTKKALHAKNDVAQIRDSFFEEIATMEFSAQFVVARKVEKVFRNNFQAQETQFYHHLISVLFQNNLHLHHKNHIYFAQRGSSTRQEPLNSAINEAVTRFEQKNNRIMQNQRQIYAQTPSAEPCLSIIDYMNWAVQRAFIYREIRYIDMVRSKISLIFDLYDTKAREREKFYDRKNSFELNKIAPL